MLPRASGLVRQGARACQACQRTRFATLASAPDARSAASDRGSTCTCASLQVCVIHGDSAAAANPDNKPTPPGKDRHDPSNVKEDTPSKDDEDSPDWAPGYYDEKGSGGHREVASRHQSGQMPASPPSSRAPQQTPEDMPSDWKPKEKDDPNQPKPEDPLKADVPNFNMKSAGHAKEPMSAADRTEPNQDPPLGRSTEISEGSMADRHSRQAGMPEPQAPPEMPAASGPASEKATAYNRSSPFGDSAEAQDFDRPADCAAKQGQVKVGQKPSGYSWEK